MDDRRVTPVAGLLSVVLFVVAFAVIQSGDTTDDKSTGAEIAGYLADSFGTLAFAAVLWAVGTIALIWFLDGLRARIAPASGQLARLVYGFGFGAALFLLASVIPNLAGAHVSDSLDRNLEGGAAEALASLSEGFFIAAELMLVGFFFAVGLAAVRGRSLPAWLGWISLVLAVVALIPEIGWAVVSLAFPLWLLVVSALLWREPTVETTPVS
jgi:MFS family permease